MIVSGGFSNLLPRDAIAQDRERHKTVIWTYRIPDYTNMVGRVNTNIL